MNVEIETSEGYVVVHPVGAMDALTTPKVQEAVDRVMKDEPSLVVIDLADVPYISSSGLRVFIVAAKGLKANGGDLAVCGLSPPVRQMFDLAGFDRILRLCDDLQSAKSLSN